MKPLEKQLKEFTKIGCFAGHEILARGSERILYDIVNRKISKRYFEGDDIYNYIARYNKRRLEDETI